MTLQDNRSLGILGGMGPAATHYFFGKVIEHRNATTDQDHIRVVIDSNPSIPDRTEYLLGDGPSPLPKLQAAARVLEAADVSAIAMPCHTSHYFLDELEGFVTVPFIDMIEETITSLNQNDVHECLLLATDATIKTGLYSNDSALSFIPPNDEAQAKVMEAIFGEHGIKAGHYEQPVALIEDVIRQSAAHHVLLGCTELSLIAEDIQVRQSLVDPLELLARRSIDQLTTDSCKNVTTPC